MDMSSSSEYLEKWEFDMISLDVQTKGFRQSFKTVPFSLFQEVRIELKRKPFVREYVAPGPAKTRKSFRKKNIGVISGCGGGATRKINFLRGSFLVGIRGPKKKVIVGHVVLGGKK